MDILLPVLVGASFTAWVFTVVGGAYLGWKYVYLPWGVMRADVKALAEAVGAVKEEIGLRRAMTLTDEEQATIERRAKARSLWSSGSAPVAPAVQAPKRG